MYYLYRLDHLGSYRKVWHLIPEVAPEHYSQHMQRSLTEYAYKHGFSEENMRIVWFSEPQDVSEFVSSVYYTQQEKIKTLYACE
jgi:hypothetical protein